jgi:hypothetical protein
MHLFLAEASVTFMASEISMVAAVTNPTTKLIGFIMSPSVTGRRFVRQIDRKGSELISGIECGRANPELDTPGKIAAALGDASASYWMNGRGRQTRRPQPVSLPPPTVFNTAVSYICSVGTAVLGAPDRADSPQGPPFCGCFIRCEQ